MAYYGFVTNMSMLGDYLKSVGHLLVNECNDDIEDVIEHREDRLREFGCTFSSTTEFAGLKLAESLFRLKKAFYMALFCIKDV